MVILTSKFCEEESPNIGKGKRPLPNRPYFGRPEVAKDLRLIFHKRDFLLCHSEGFSPRNLRRLCFGWSWRRVSSPPRFKKEIPHNGISGWRRVVIPSEARNLLFNRKGKQPPFELSSKRDKRKSRSFWRALFARKNLLSYLYGWSFERGFALLEIKYCPEALPGNTFNQ